MSQGRFIRVIIAEDETIIRNHIIHKIEQIAPDFRIVASTFNGKDALEAIIQLQPDAVFTDIRMPIVDGIELITRIRPLYPELPIVVLSGYNDFEYARQALRHNVLDYLLKPLDDVMLQQTLDHIRAKVLSTNTNQQRLLLSSELHGEDSAGEIPGDLEHSVFQMFLICIGNLCNHITSMNNASMFGRLWREVDWPFIIPQMSPAIQDWWLIDEKMSNQKVLIMAFPDDYKGAAQPAAERLQQLLQEAVSPYPVTISLLSGVTKQTELWERVQRLRLLMEQGVIIGKSQILVVPETHQQAELRIPALPLLQLKSVLDNREAFRKMVYEHFQALELAAVPQRRAEASFAELIRMIQRSRIESQATAIYDLEYAIAEQICSLALYGEVCDGIWELAAREMDTEIRADGTVELVESITRYIKNHYSEDISLEELAQQLNFSSAYLTKIFKKHMNESPLKYMIGYRISEAKRLIIEHPDLDIRIIAEMTGYLDQHYFSKVFKGIVGQTPSEYRTEWRALKTGKERE